MANLIEEQKSMSQQKEQEKYLTKIDRCLFNDRERNEQWSIGSDIPLHIIGPWEVNSSNEENDLFKMLVDQGNIYRYVLW